MKSHNCKHFSQLLSICNFFKYQARAWQADLSTGIQLMTLDELFTNIMNSDFETTLMREIVMFLVANVENPKFQGGRSGGVKHFLGGQFHRLRGEFIQLYYMQMALQQYFCLTGIEQNIKQYYKIYNFYQLDSDIKFKLLETLIKNILKYSYPKKLKKNSEREKEKQQDGQNKQSKKSKLQKIQQLLILGQDERTLYFFASYLPEYVLTLFQGQWNVLDRLATKGKILDILGKPKCVNLLFLAENLSTVQRKFMIENRQNSNIIRLHRVKQNRINRQNQILVNLKSKLLDINQRYNKYLQKFNRRCWGYLHQRQDYVRKITQSKNLDQLIEAFNFFFLISHAKLFIIKCEDQEKIPLENCHQFYQSEIRPFCNINTVKIKITQTINVKSQQISKRIIQQQHADVYPLFYFNILLLEQAVKLLEKKSQRYYQRQKKLKQQEQNQKVTEKEKGRYQQNIKGRGQVPQFRQTRRILRSRIQSDVMISKNSISSIQSKNDNKKRTRKVKKHGVTMIDSDQSDQDYKSKEQSSNLTHFNKYAYNTRKIKNLL